MIWGKQNSLNTSLEIILLDSRGSSVMTLQFFAPYFSIVISADFILKRQTFSVKCFKASGYLTTHFHRGGWFLGRSHWGIDIAARKGSPIRAAGSGIIIMADWTPDFGNIVVISHGNGFFTYYGHAMRLLVDQGFHVKKGDAIALLGSSGSSSAPHLHFEIWKNGKPIDPEQFLFVVQKEKEES